MKNLDFDGGWTRDTHTGQEYGEIFTAEGWVTFWAEGGTIPNDPDNSNGYGRPEAHVINWEPPFIDPPRLNTTGDGHRDVKLFTFYRAHDAGVYQRIDSLHPGDKVKMTAWAHAWSSTKDDPRKSDGAHVGSGAFFAEEGTPGLDDGDKNFSFYVGVDPLGGTDPWGDNVVWGKGAHIYNVFAQIPAVEVTAQATAVTVFIRSKTLWPFKHNDAYIDDCEVTITSDDPIEQPTPDPGTSEYDYPVIAKGSKLGVHTIDLADVPDLMLQAPVVSVKALDPGALIDVKIINGNCIAVARYMNGVDDDVNEEAPDLNGDIEAEANRVANSLFPLWRAVRADAEEEGVSIDYFEVCNELDPVGVEGHVKFAEFFMYFMPLAEAEGFKILLFSYSLGVPEWEEWEGIVATGVFAMAKAGGHALALHEYAYPIDWWYGEPLPGRPTYADRGSLSCRYRWLYEDFLKPQDQVIPLFITEFNLALGKGDDEGLNLVTGQEWIEQMAWYDNELRKDYYVIAAHMFTLQGIDIWEYYDYGRFFPQLISYLNATSEVPNALPPDPTVDPEPVGEVIKPRVSYERTYLLLPPGADSKWLEATAGIWDAWRVTIGGSADDAGIGLVDYRRIIAVNPDEWDDDLEAFFDVYYTGAEYIAVVADSPAELVVKLALLVRGEVEDQDLVPFSQRDERWSAYRLGTSTATMHSSGCLVTDAASISTLVDPTMNPGKMVEWLNANGGFTPTGEMYISKPAQFVDGLEYYGYYTWRGDGEVADMNMVREALSRGPVIVQVDYVPGSTALDSHFVIAMEESSNDLLIMDPWTGAFDWLSDVYWRGSLEESIFAMVDYRFSDTEPEPEPEPEPTDVLIGFNDHEGVGGGATKFMSDVGHGGLLVQPAFIGGDAWQIDATAAEADGVRVIVNLRYSWDSMDNGGAGTLPLPGTTEWDKFVAAAISTINNSKGVWGFSIGNEMNNPREFPLDGPLTPQAVVDTYNYIYARYARVGAHRLAVGALDPFNAEAGDPKDWLKYIFDRVYEPSFIVAHGYVRGPDPAFVGSTAKFTDDPLKWQYLNYPGCITALLDGLPDVYRDNPKPIYVTEFNHLYKYDGSYGWVDDNMASEVLDAAYNAAKVAGFAGLAVYRWTGDAWEVKSNGSVLGAVDRLLSL